MTKSKNLGVWMDHASANLMEFAAAEMETVTIESNYSHDHDSGKNENLMQNKHQHQLAAFYKEITEAIKKYNDVVLFGPTDAKVELFNLLKEDHHFSNIKIEVRQADKMTDNQQHAFVRDYFSKG